MNITNGNRLETYIIRGARGTGQVCINGAAAHLVQEGDLVIIASYCQLSDEEFKYHKPHIVYVNADNRVLSKSTNEQVLI